MDIVSQVRGYHFMLGVFRNQQADPYCSVCSAFANTLRAAKESFAKLEAEHADALGALPHPFAGMLVETRAGMSTLSGPVEPTGQKKAGNCKLPQGVCFIKAPFSILQQI